MGRPKETKSEVWRMAEEIIKSDNEIGSGELREKLAKMGFKVSGQEVWSNFGGIRRRLNLIGTPTRGRGTKRRPTEPYKTVVELLKNGPTMSYRDVHRRLNELGITVSLSRAKYAFQRARRDLELIGKPTTARVPRYTRPHEGSTMKISNREAKGTVPTRQKEHLSGVQGAVEPIRESTSFSPTSDQIIDSIVWMGTELKKARGENKELLTAMGNLANRNRELSSSNSKLAEENARLHAYIRKVNERQVSIEMEEGRSENSLTGKNTPY